MAVLMQLCTVSIIAPTALANCTASLRRPNRPNNVIKLSAAKNFWKKYSRPKFGRSFPRGTPTINKRCSV